MREIIQDLINLKEYWQLQSIKQEPYYNNYNSIDQFCEDLDILITKYQEINADDEQFQK